MRSVSFRERRIFVPAYQNRARTDRYSTKLENMLQDFSSGDPIVSQKFVALKELELECLVFSVPVVNKQTGRTHPAPREGKVFSRGVPSRGLLS